MDYIIYYTEERSKKEKIMQQRTEGKKKKRFILNWKVGLLVPEFGLTSVQLLPNNKSVSP